MEKMSSKAYVKLIPDCTVLVVGLGLMGASYAKALSAKGYTVHGITPDKEVIDCALAEGVIHKGSTGADPELIGQADVIVLALYPTVMVEWVRQNAASIAPGTVLTDVSGVKGCVVRQVQQLLGEGVEFISAHPMAGKELMGESAREVYRAASPDMFYGANYLVVPTEQNTPEAILLCEQLGRLLGFGRVTQLSVEEHDESIAYLSQLTHAIAVALMCSAQDEGSDGEAPSALARLTGDSFRDLTRIAKINDGMWSELFLANRQPLLRQMERFSEHFDRLREALSSGDREAMRELMRQSTDRRRQFDRCQDK